MPPKKASSKATQEFLSIESVRDGILLLKGGLGLRAILMVSALNFALKSEEEQDALVFQYENFLNSLDFSVQFVIQSRKLNIQPYLEALADRQKEEPGELLKIQVAEYVEFVRTFVELSNVVSKTFYVVIPFEPSIAERRGILKSLGGLLGGAPRNIQEEEEFPRWKNQLAQRVDSVSLGLRRLGLRAVQLNTEELVELFYGLYNPSDVKSSDTTSEVIAK